MRTTLDIADDVLHAAKERARRWLSPLPKRGGIVNNELIDRLRQDD